MVCASINLQLDSVVGYCSAFEKSRHMCVCPYMCQNLFKGKAYRSKFYTNVFPRIPWIQ